MVKLTRSQIRLLVLTQLEDIKYHLLSAHAVRIVKDLINKPTTSATLAKREKISVQNASQQLNKLYARGYLLRIEVKDPTGGIMWSYWATYDLTDEDWG